MTNTKTSFSPSDSLLSLIADINSALECAEESDRSEDGSAGDYVASLGYGDGELEFSHLRDDALAERLKTWFKADARACRMFLAEHISVECRDMYLQWHEIFSISLGETEHQFDEFNARVESLTPEELEYLCRNVNAYTKDGEWFSIDHGNDRMIAILDEESAAEALGFVQSDKQLRLSDEELEALEVSIGARKPKHLSLVKCVITENELFQARMTKWKMKQK